MINTLDDYISCSIPKGKPFSTNPNLLKKVDLYGRFLQFSGNTVVFNLPDAVKAKLSVLQDELYEHAGDLLADRLEPDTFHMTLHDLVNAPGCDGVLLSRMDEIASRVKPILAVWKYLPPLRMRTTWLFNMVNTSIVLGLTPADQKSHDQLDMMYCRLEEELRLGYGLTPHITMAYYKPGTYAPEEIERLRAGLHQVNLEMELSMDQLVFQNFADMNHYFTAN